MIEKAMQEKACCIIVLSKVPSDKIKDETMRLHQEIEAAISDGYTTFISDFANDISLLFAELVCEQKEKHPNLTLEAAIPYRKRLACKNARFQKCVRECGGVKIPKQQNYSKKALLRSRRYMLALCTRVIIVNCE